MGGADEVKGLIQLAGGIIMGGLALYKLTNVDEAYEMEEPVSYQPEKRPKLTKAKQAVAPSRPHEGKSSRGDGDGRGVVSWRSSEEVAEVEAEELGSWRSKREELEAIEFEKESKESSSVPSTSASSENFDSDDEDHVPSWMSKKDRRWASLASSSRRPPSRHRSSPRRKASCAREMKASPISPMRSATPSLSTRSLLLNTLLTSANLPWSSRRRRAARSTARSAMEWM